MNKQFKGAIINIYPLESISDLEKPSKEVPSTAKSMLDVVKLKQGSDPRVQILLNSVFGNTVLTKTYDDALRVAQDHKFNCITPDFQVVYGGSFIVKVGHYNKQAQDRFGIYHQMKVLKAQIHEK